MDLSEFLPKSDVVTVDLVNPKTKEPLGMSVTVHANHTPEFKDVNYAYIDKAIAKRDAGEVVSSRDADEGRVNLLAEITVSWDITIDGKKPKLTVEKAKEVYNLLPFIRNQIEAKLEESEGFI